MKVGILTVIIIILLLIIIAEKKKNYTHVRSCPNPNPIILNPTVNVQPVKTPEKDSIVSNATYFGNCAADASMKHALNACTEDEYKYAIDDFGAPGADFKDWVTSQAVDLQVIKNHAEYVADREATTTQNITGKTFSPDSHDSYDPIPWIGLRRPQAVPTCNPTQVPDVNYDLYEKSAKFTWKSS